MEKLEQKTFKTDMLNKYGTDLTKLAEQVNQSSTILPLALPTYSLSQLSSLLNAVL